MSEIIDRIRSSLVGLRMPRALEVLDHTMRCLERGEMTALEAIDILLTHEHGNRESRRFTVGLKTSRLMPLKTLEGFDFSFQPSLDRGRILALAQLDFIERGEVVHLLGPPGTGKSHLATALGAEAVRAGKRVYRASLAEVIDMCQRHCKNPRKWQSKIPHFAVRVVRWFVPRLHFWVGVRGGGARRAQVV